MGAEDIGNEQSFGLARESLNASRLSGITNLV